MSKHDVTYHKMLEHILKEGENHDDRTGVGTVSVFGYQCRYDLADGFPLLTTKKVSLKNIVTELVWFLRGITDNKWLTDRGCTIWNEWATAEQCAKFGRAEGDLGPVYGHQWRRFGAKDVGPIGGHPFEGPYVPSYSGGVDQIQKLSYGLRNTPNSRRLIVSGWNPAESDDVALPPCHTMFQCKVRKGPKGSRGILDLHLMQRSGDAFIGIPYNIASYSILLQLLAHTHGMRPGTFVHTIADLHIYSNHRDQVNEQLGRDPLTYVAPTVVLDPSLHDTGFDGLMAFDWEHVKLHNYQPYPAIKAPVAV